MTHELKLLPQYDDDFRYGMNRAVEIICEHSVSKQREINSKQTDKYETQLEYDEIDNM